ncbi:type IV secretory system conjugative DNA transfer family protein [Micromonospora sp. BRA006-A]|nr:type IV secretory system conjugative DNA transfer family protein [Micromonospora sp. BRA006-A]
MPRRRRGPGDDEPRRAAHRGTPGSPARPGDRHRRGDGPLRRPVRRAAGGRRRHRPAASRIRGRGHAATARRRAHRLDPGAGRGVQRRPAAEHRPAAARPAAAHARRAHRGPGALVFPGDRRRPPRQRRARPAPQGERGRRPGHRIGATEAVPAAQPCLVDQRGHQQGGRGVHRGGRPDARRRRGGPASPLRAAGHARRGHHGPAGLAGRAPADPGAEVLQHALADVDRWTTDAGPPPEPDEPSPAAAAATGPADPSFVVGHRYDDGNRCLALEALRKHTTIFAGSGSGKTVLIRRIVEECALAGVSAIVLDPNNDLARLGEDGPSRPRSGGRVTRTGPGTTSRTPTSSSGRRAATRAAR